MQEKLETMELDYIFALNYLTFQNYSNTTHCDTDTHTEHGHGMP